MSIIVDARGNPFQGSIDTIGGETFTDARVSSATLASLNAELRMDIQGKAVAKFELRAAAVVTGTFIFEVTLNGSDWYTVPAIIESTEAMTAAVVLSGATVAQTYNVSTTGWRTVRVKCSAYTSGSVVAVGRATVADFAIYAKPTPSLLFTAALSSANTSAVTTLAAAGAGLFHYITAISMVRIATAALAGSALLTVTSTNLPTSMAWNFGNAMAAGGTQTDFSMSFQHPIKSSVANTNTTITYPAAGAAVQSRVGVWYYVGA